MPESAFATVPSAPGKREKPIPELAVDEDRLAGAATPVPVASGPASGDILSAGIRK